MKAVLTTVAGVAFFTLAFTNGNAAAAITGVAFVLACAVAGKEKDE